MTLNPKPWCVEVGFPICDGADPREWPDEVGVWQASVRVWDFGFRV